MTKSQKLFLLALFSLLTLSRTAFCGSAHSLPALHRAKGPIGISALGGYQWPRLMNSDGSFAGYSGYLLGGQFSLNIIGNDNGGFSIFGQYITGTANQMSSQNSKLTRTSEYAGVLFKIGAGFFIGSTYGWETLRDTDLSGNDTNLHSNTVSVGGGVNFLNISDSVDLNLQGWYRLGFLPKNANSALVNNSGISDVDVIIGICWTPTLGRMEQR